MADNPTLEILGADYEFTLQVNGTWQGIDCRYVPSDLLTIYAKILKFQPFEASEFSLANFTMMRDRGVEHMVAIPVFVNRASRPHHLVFCSVETSEGVAVGKLSCLNGQLRNLNCRQGLLGDRLTATQRRPLR